MNWNKLRQQLDSFLTPKLAGRVEYRASGYRYSPDKKMQCYMTVDKKEVFNMKDNTTNIPWYQTEQEIKSDTNFEIFITPEDIEKVKKELGDKVPEERLAIIARNNKLTQYSKDVLKTQVTLLKTDFKNAASDFLSKPIEKCLESDDIILNVLAIVDRRVGKKRLIGMENEMRMKHPVVRYFYDLRRRA